MKLDAARSTIAIYTYAEGLFSALAHDLELAAHDVAGEGDAGEARVELRIPVRGIAVSGVMKRGKLDRGVLSASDRETIERQIREDVFRSGGEIVARGRRDPGDGRKRAQIEIVAPAGRVELAADVDVSSDAGALRARGEVDVSLRSLGVAPVKGPMGAFRVSDRVRIVFDLVLAKD